MTLQSCSLLIDSPEARYEQRDAATADAAGAEPPPTGEPDSGGATPAAGADAAVPCRGPACAEQPSAGCPLSLDECSLGRWDVERQRCIVAPAVDCFPCGTEGRCVNGVCTPGGVFFFDGFEGDTLQPPWHSGSSIPWTIDTSASYFGQHSLRSGAIPDDTTSDLTLQFAEVSPYARIRFWYRTDTEVGFDTLTFMVNDTEIGTWSDIPEWQQIEVPLTPGGDVSLHWSYRKDVSGSDGADRVWIDDVTLYLVCNDDTQ